MKELLKVPTEQEIEAKFEKVIKTIEDTDYNDFKEVFNAGVKYVLDYQAQDTLKTSYVLGFPVDLAEIHRLLTDDATEGYDELYGVNDINFTKIEETSNKITIIFEAFYSHRREEDMSIVIDDKGRVNVDLADSPWEGSGVEGEIVEITMRYVTKQKYL